MWIKNSKSKKNYKSKKNVRHKPEDKHFPNLTDKKMLKVMALYDNLCKRHSKLENKRNLLKTENKKIYDLLDNVNGFSNIIKKELNNLKCIYAKTIYRDFIKQTKPFKNLLSVYKKFIQELEIALASEKSPTPPSPTNPQKQR